VHPSQTYQPGRPALQPTGYDDDAPFQNVLAPGGAASGYAQVARSYPSQLDPWGQAAQQQQAQAFPMAEVPLPAGLPGSDSLNAHSSLLRTRVRSLGMGALLAAVLALLGVGLTLALEKTAGSRSQLIGAYAGCLLLSVVTYRISRRLDEAVDPHVPQNQGQMSANKLRKAWRSAALFTAIFTVYCTVCLIIGGLRFCRQGMNVSLMIALGLPFYLPLVWGVLLYRLKASVSTLLLRLPPDAPSAAQLAPV